MNRADDAQVIDHPGDVGEYFTYFRPALAMLLKLEGRTYQVAHAVGKGKNAGRIKWQRLAVVSGQDRLTLGLLGSWELKHTQNRQRDRQDLRAQARHN